MIPGRVYMHKNAMDVCIQVIRLHTSLLRPRVKVLWYNLGYTGNPWALSSDQLLILKHSDWIDITDRVTNVRTRPGLP